MSYTSLIGDKNTAGSIARWVNYAKLDADQILQEAQSLLYSMLRVREMRAHFNFSTIVGQDRVALPSGFLDPIGKIAMLGTGAKIEQRYPNFIQRRRTYTETTGNLGSNPFTTNNPGPFALIVNVNLPNHGFSDGSVFFTTGAMAFNGVTIVGTFDVVALIDANNFWIDITPLGTTPTAGGSGGTISGSVTATSAGAGNVIQLTLGAGDAASVAGFTSGNTVVVNGVGGTTEANGTWVIDVIISGGLGRINLRGSTFVHSWTSGGTVTTTVAYICDNLVQGMPLHWGVWDETIFFDVAFSQPTNCNLQYFRSLPILSAANPTNFLTTRYPHLLRKACTAQAWDFLRNNTEYQKDVAALTALVEQTNAEADLLYRGAAFDTYLHDE
jgi:hypothetical protein